jgi:hypothetical protein
MEILIQSKSIYGQIKLYPMNAAAQALADIAGTKTLSESTLRLAEKLGHTVRELPVLARV